ncbi:hypothetical protein B296_00032495, partial [Ensete ventricosum]
KWTYVLTRIYTQREPLGFGLVVRGSTLAVGLATSAWAPSARLCKRNKVRAHAYILNINLTGHSAVLHGCIVEDEAFVGMGAVLLDGVVVEKHGMVAGGALVRHNTKIPSGEVPPPHFCFIKLLVFFIEYATSNYPATAIILLICCLNLSLS